MPNPLNMIVNVANNLVNLTRERLIPAPSVDYTTRIEVDTSDETKFEIFPGIPAEVGNKILRFLSEEEQLPLRLINHAFRLRVDDLTIAQIAQWNAQQAEIDHFIASKDHITSKFKNSTRIMSALESLKNVPTIKLLATLLAREKILDSINGAIIKERIENPFPIVNLYLNLNLSRCYLTRFPSSIINQHPTFFKNLEKLNLFGNEIQTLPSNFKQLVKLEELNLSSNKLTIIPNVIKDLNKLKYLIVSFNQISLLPDWIDELKFLESFYIECNELTVFPASISQLTNINILYASFNRLESIPDLSTLTRLRFISIGNNHLRTFPNGLVENTGLEKLHIDNNFLTEIPDDFKEDLLFDRHKHVSKAQVLASQKPTAKRKIDHSDDDEREDSLTKRLRA